MKTKTQGAAPLGQHTCWLKPRAEALRLACRLQHAPQPARASREWTSGNQGLLSLHRAGCSRVAASAPAAPSAEGTRPSNTDQAGLVFSYGGSGAWDSKCVGNPVVRCFLGDNEQRWMLWYSGHARGPQDIDALYPAAGSIGLATSGDGISWARGSQDVVSTTGEDGTAGLGCCLPPNGSDWWWLDTCHLTVSDVQVFSSTSVGEGAGVYWMFYSGGNYENGSVPSSLPGAAAACEGARARPGLAMSQDGRNWARIEGPHHTGALFDAGQEGSPDSLLAAGPQVLGGPPDLQMYYHGFDESSGRFVICRAASKDGLQWDKRGPCFSGAPEGQEDAFDALGATSHHVIRDAPSRRFVMFYEGVARDGRRSIGVAVSRDGQTGWTRHPQPILGPSEQAGSWDGASVGAPCAVPMADGRWRLYYAGRSAEGAWTGIGLALTDPSQDLTLEGVNIGFKRRRQQ